MKIFAVPFLTAVLAMGLAAGDSTQTKTKSTTVDPVTGDQVKVKTRVKTDADGDYKVDGKTQVKSDAGKAKSSVKVRGEADGDYKEKVKTSGPEGKTESKTKVDR